MKFSDNQQINGPVRRNLEVLSNRVDDGFSATRGFKNHFLNGSFDLWGRGLGFFTTNTYVADMWYVESATSTHSLVAYSCPPSELGDLTGTIQGPTLKLTNIVTSVANANAYSLLRTNIENVRTLAGKTVTLSFWSRAATNSEIAIEFVNQYGTGGSPSAATTNFVAKPTISTVWKRYSFTLTMPSLAGKTLGTDGAHTSYVAFQIFMDAGSAYNARTNSMAQHSSTYDFWGFQLEVGSTVSDFEVRPLAVEKTMIGRYFERWTSADSLFTGIASGMVLSATQARIWLPFTVEKRKKATMSFGTVSLWGALNVPGSAVLTATGLSARDSSRHGADLVLDVASGLVAGDATIMYSQNSLAAVVYASAEF